MGLQKVFGAVLFVAFFVWLHFSVRSWAIGAGIAGSTCNAGGPFGIPLPQWLLIGLSTVVLVFVMTFVIARYRKEWTLASQWPWLLIISGGTGNLLERLSFGCIMDYVTLPFFPAFNIADILLTVGVLGIVLRWHCRNEKCKNQKSQ